MHLATFISAITIATVTAQPRRLPGGVNCSAYGRKFRHISVLGPIKLDIERTTTCATGECLALPQIQSLDQHVTEKSESIETAKCVFQAAHKSVFSLNFWAPITGPMYVCSYYDRKGNHIRVAHSFALFMQTAIEEPQCVVKGSLVAMYSTVPVIPHIKMTAYIVITILVLGAYTIGLCFGLICCRKKKQGYKSVPPTVAE